MRGASRLEKGSNFAGKRGEEERRRKGNECRNEELAFASLEEMKGKSGQRRQRERERAGERNKEEGGFCICPV